MLPVVVGLVLQFLFLDSNFSDFLPGNSAHEHYLYVLFLFVCVFAYGLTPFSFPVHSNLDTGTCDDDCSCVSYMLTGGKSEHENKAFKDLKCIVQVQ